MSYSASTDVFYGVLLPDDLDTEDLESEIEEVGLIPVFYGNFVCGDVGAAIAIKTVTADESHAAELSLEFSPKELKKIEILEQFLKERNIPYNKISWYCAASYG